MLHSNGDIMFAYKEVPIKIANIAHEEHPVKVGLSDAYIIDRTIFCKPLALANHPKLSQAKPNTCHLLAHLLRDAKADFNVLYTGLQDLL